MTSHNPSESLVVSVGIPPGGAAHVVIEELTPVPEPPADTTPAEAGLISAMQKAVLARVHDETERRAASAAAAEETECVSAAAAATHQTRCYVCGMQTQRICERCSKVFFCSERCVQEGAGDHIAICTTVPPNTSRIFNFFNKHPVLRKQASTLSQHLCESLQQSTHGIFINNCKGNYAVRACEVEVMYGFLDDGPVKKIKRALQFIGPKQTLVGLVDDDSLCWCIFEIANAPQRKQTSEAQSENK